MDADRFDALSRTFATGTTRRRAVGALGFGGLLAALLGKPGRVLAQETTCVLTLVAAPAPDSNAPAFAGTKADSDGLAARRCCAVVSLM